ncbi:AAA family ATPase [Bacillus toyonensis]|uniref:AAA family ATPase n=1 Tax=Bacillus toyonensis TaxID=155322 RepID=UPI000BF76158|nr:AAA family ATPase [Bacillus toyonensis]PGE68217.1 ATP/GTP-binding protein [Bacillus toyonensis]PHD44984.1 ATP/GTP-binding protein [Bacillus toyonensis]
MLSSKKPFGIKNFKINKLFGRSNVNISFDENIRIFVGENGIGKTTILNILYYTICKEFDRIAEFEFGDIEIEFISGEKIKFSKVEMEPKFNGKKNNEFYGNRKNTPMFQLMALAENVLPRKKYREFMNKMNSHAKVQEIVEFVIKEGKVPKSLMNEVLNKRIDVTNYTTKKFELIRKLDKYVQQEILYFPTYRRIEEDLNKLGFDLDLYKDNMSKTEARELIKFGMDDVQKVFNDLEEKIKSSALKGYSHVTGEMITHLVHDENVSEEMQEKVKNADTLEIVLDRVGENLKNPDKEKIKKLVKEDKLFDDNKQTYKPLIFFLSKLIDIYELHREKEEAIKMFTEVCNEYLVNKKISYDESDVKISIIEKSSGENINLKDLSSGEKQIVSLFCRVYLSSNKNFIVLFDEPELSLSIEWQERLLPDITKSEKCDFLLAVTHSPFVFNNELENYTQSMELLIEEVVGTR